MSDHIMWRTSSRAASLSSPPPYNARQSSAQSSHNAIQSHTAEVESAQEDPSPEPDQEQIENVELIQGPSSNGNPQANPTILQDSSTIPPQRMPLLPLSLF